MLMGNLIIHLIIFHCRYEKQKFYLESHHRLFFSNIHSTRRESVVVEHAQMGSQFRETVSVQSERKIDAG